MKIKKVYLTGAQCTGKTTLAKHISVKHNVELVTEVTRDVVNSMGMTLEEVRSDLHTSGDVQERIATEQLKREVKTSEPYVSDRCFDFLAYTGMYAVNLQRLFQSETVQEYLDYATADSVFFFARPQMAFREKDGFRENVDWDNILQIDGMIKYLLEYLDINYISINTPYTNERTRLVDGVLEWLEWSDSS